MKSSFISNLRELKNEVPKDWYSLKDCCKVLNMTRQNLDVYRRKYQKLNSVDAFEKRVRDEKNRITKYFSPEFVEYAREEKANIHKPFVISKPIKQDEPPQVVSELEEEILEKDLIIESLIDDNDSKEKKNKKIKAELKAEKKKQEAEFDADNLPPLEAKNGVVRYYFDEREYENMIVVSSQFPIIKKELAEARAELKEAQKKIDVLTNELVKSLQATQKIISENNHIEYEKLKSKS